MLKSLQAGRAIAALSVLAFHLHGSTVLPIWGQSHLAALSAHGNAGVDFFFVLSGFIIAFAHGDDIGKPDRALRYFRNRFVRVYPIYWLYTLAFLLLVALFGAVAPMPETTLDRISSFSLLRLSDGHHPLSVAWTLFYEIAFYLLFSLLILSKRLGVAAFSVWAVVILIFHRSTANDDPAGVWTSLACVNFFVGMGAYWVHRRLNRLGAWAMMLAALGVFIYAGSHVDHGLAPRYFKLLVALACGLLICGVAAIESRASLNLGPLSVIGNASYTLYLIHVHVGSAILKLLSRIAWLHTAPADLIFVLAVALTTGVAVALYFAVEKPLVGAFKAHRAVTRPATA